ncbi:glucose receptor git3 protein [Purpureocillium lavendulum]|uniref:Glucose receptor git3 protein n=1 Tax=Purpureocillium lavendulum TaxID=1247861 RepID=A0AB34FDL9_9HYPO|nr:glucose receptor git3 protein [Purpureocillium lavendulum]
MPLAEESGSFDGGDQGLLNIFFGDGTLEHPAKQVLGNATNRQRTVRTWYRLSFTYNIEMHKVYRLYISAVLRYRPKHKVIHFIGEEKPWHFPNGKIDRLYDDSAYFSFYCEMVDKWWDVCRQVDARQLQVACCPGSTSFAMIVGVLIFPLVLAGVGHAELTSDFEPADFNVTSELLAMGVRVNTIDMLERLARRDGPGPCAAACKALSVVYDSNAVFSQDQTGYSDFTGTYWSSIQSEVVPQCVFRPSAPKDVSLLILLSRLSRCPFAFKSGGHAAFAGASSAQGGITVSFENFKNVTVSHDKKTVKIQPGNSWVDVYRALEPYEITVTGGRVARVGTGGLTLGGRIVHATPTAFPRLFWALRGGGNNFGIVTSFTFEAIPFPQNQMWGGTKTYLESSFNGVVDAFAGVVANSPTDPKAGLWVAWIQQGPLKLAATELWYAKPNGSGAAIFSDFMAMTPIADSTQNRNLSEYADAQQKTNPYGLREVYWCVTTKADARIARIARDIYYQERPAVAHLAGARPVLIFQGITEGHMRHMEKNGGNAVGLDYRNGPLYIIQIACWWNSAADDAAIYAFIQKAMDRITAEATTLGVQSDYIYMNYGSKFQNVIAGYGAANVDKLHRIAGEFDPKGVFQTLQPGHFKLDRSPAPPLATTPR